MTHTLHRVGDPDSLKRDFVIYGLSAQDAEFKEKIIRNTKETHTQFMEICIKHNPINAGCIYPSSKPYSKTLIKGNIWDDMKADIIPFTETLAVFDDISKVEQVLAELKEADLGISVVVSSIFDELFKCCKKIELVPHTVNIALGIMGNKELIPKRKVLDVITMCGHGLVSRYLVKHLVQELKSGRVSAEAASRILGAQCVCGAFNTKRAAKILDEMAKNPRVELV
jgi:hypothetical protein